MQLRIGRDPTTRRCRERDRCCGQPEVRDDRCCRSSVPTVQPTDAARAAVAWSGERVLAIVEGCTDADTHPKPPWRQRKERYIARLAQADASVVLDLRRAWGDDHDCVLLRSLLQQRQSSPSGQRERRVWVEIEVRRIHPITEQHHGRG